MPAVLSIALARELSSLADNGMMAVQGLATDAATLATMENVLPGESGVLIKPKIIVEAARLYQASSA